MSHLRFALTACLIALLLAELALRSLTGNFAVAELVGAVPDERCVALLPDRDVQYTGAILKIPAVRQETNADGYRGPQLPQARTPGICRIAVLGDSFVYGMGETAAATVPAAIERTLKAQGRAVEVMNFGVPGYNLDESRTAAAVFASRWQPDAVVLLVFRNDRQEPLCAQTKASGLHRLAFRHVVLYRILYLFSRYRTIDSAVHGEPGQQLAAWRRDLARLQKVSPAPPWRTVVGILESPYASLSPGELAAAAVEAGMVGLNLYGPHIEAPRIPREGHYDAAGAQVMGDVLAEQLHRAGICAGLP
jgi:hypothetical protein